MKNKIILVGFSALLLLPIAACQSVSHSSSETEAVTSSASSLAQSEADVTLLNTARESLDRSVDRATN